MTPSTLLDPRRVLSQNTLPALAGHNEPTVETSSQILSVVDVPGFGGQIRKAMVANTTVLARNDNM